MMIQTNHKISRFQLFFVMVQTQIGIASLPLAHDVHKFAGSDSWMSILICGVLVQILLLLMWALCQRHPQLTIYEIAPQLLGKFLGYGVNLLFIGYFMFFNTMLMLLYYEMVRRWFYPLTPKWVVLGLVLLVSVYMAKQNIRVIARICTIVTLTHIVLIALLFISLGETNILYLLPIGQTDPKDLFLGAQEALLAVNGFQIILILFPMVQANPKEILKTATYANIYVTLFYTLIVFLCTIYFTPEEIPYIVNPVLYMLNTFSFKIIERVDLLFFSIWIVSCFTTFALFVYMGGMGLASFRQDKNQTKIVIYVAVVCYLIAILVHDPFAGEKWARFFTPINPYMHLVLPLLLLIISYLRKRKVQTS